MRFFLRLFPLVGLLAAVLLSACTTHTATTAPYKNKQIHNASLTVALPDGGGSAFWATPDSGRQLDRIFVRELPSALPGAIKTNSYFRSVRVAPLPAGTDLVAQTISPAKRTSFTMALPRTGETVTADSSEFLLFLQGIEKDYRYVNVSAASAATMLVGVVVMKPGFAISSQYVLWDNRMGRVVCSGVLEEYAPSIPGDLNVKTFADVLSIGVLTGTPFSGVRVTGRPRASW